MTVVLITHEMSVVRSICTSAALLDDGLLVDSGPLAERVGDPHSPLGNLLLPFDTTPPTIGEHHLLLTFTNADGGSAVLSQLARDLDLNVAIRSGGVERIGGTEIGRLQVSLDTGGRSGSRPVDSRAVARYLSERGVRAEVHA